MAVTLMAVIVVAVAIAVIVPRVLLAGRDS
jgi:hypothetical protein